jgi:RNA polymerase sigma factor (sigma-70 family)
MKLIALTLRTLSTRAARAARAPPRAAQRVRSQRRLVRGDQAPEERPADAPPLQPLLMAARTSATAPGRQLDTLIAAAQAGDELAFRRLLRRHQRLLEQQAARFYLPGGDPDDVLQEARIGFAKAVRAYRPERGASFARRCVGRELATALTAARRAKPAAERSRPGRSGRARLGEPVRRTNPADLVQARELLSELGLATSSLTALERKALAHTLLGWSSGEAAHRLGVPPTPPPGRSSPTG